ncbi:MAG TPA: SH3 domain-containing protein [Ktedonobacterales bacterium]
MATIRAHAVTRQVAAWFPAPSRGASAALAARLIPLALLCWTLAATPLSVIAHAAPPAVVYAQRPCTAAREAPSSAASLITQLIGGSELTVVAEVSDSTGTRWMHVKMWSGIDAFVTSADVAATPPDPAREGVCAFPGLPDALTSITPTGTGPWPLSARGTITARTLLLPSPDASTSPGANLSAGDRLVMDSWASGAAGLPWYHATVAGGAVGWLPATSVRIDQPDPATRTVEDAPIWTPVAGKGMWFTNYLPHHSDVQALVRAAKLAGLTHVYAEVGISPYGFYARGTLDRLLPAAHAAGLKVIAWVYPYLSDVSGDVHLTQEVATYQTPSGDHPDGIATDIEEMIDTPAVFAYGQLLRALLGPDELMVASVMHPLTHPNYPYAAIATSWNVIAPMDYWHGRRDRAYAPADVQRFVATSLTGIRGAVGPSFPIEELGQTYDMYTDDGAGASSAPSPDEIAADIDAARRLGCIGVSYFEWQTATQAEWRVLTDALW